MADGLVENIADYIVAYCERYKVTFKNLVAPAPEGQGLPRVSPPPFASVAPLQCWIMSDGVVLVDLSEEPQHSWYIAGGPGLKVDFEPTRTPQYVFELLKRDGLIGKPIGIYRIVGRDIPDDIWRGKLPQPFREFSRPTSFGKIVTFYVVTTTTVEFLKSLTYGAFGYILDAHLKSEGDDFWDNIRFRRIGIFPADLSSKRFFRLIEIAHNMDIAAWDIRGLWLRVHFDCWCDILFETHFVRHGASQLSRFLKSADVAALLDRTRHFEGLINELQQMLAFRNDDDEVVFQKFLERHPELLDLYGSVTPRPRFEYPHGTSPTGKTYIEPDFVIAYGDGTYRIVEIERPGKRLATSRGQPRSELTQSAFQLSEFKSFIDSHANVLQKSFPGIRASACRYTLIIGRKIATEDSPYKTSNSCASTFGILIALTTYGSSMT
jgi:Domain of unknown function (DUF4263)